MHIAGELTHMQPLSAAFDHALAFRRQLTKIRCKHRRRDDRARHYCDQELDGIVVVLVVVFPDDMLRFPEQLCFVYAEDRFSRLTFKRCLRLKPFPFTKCSLRGHSPASRVAAAKLAPPQNVCLSLRSYAPANRGFLNICFDF